MVKPKHHVDTSIKAVVGYEIIKGVVALITAVVLWVCHTDFLSYVETASTAWVNRFGGLFSPQVNSVIYGAQQAVQNWQLFLLMVVGYAFFRFIEAYGFWYDKVWAYWIGILGYGLFIPVEIYYLATRPFDWFKLAILVLNIIVVAIVYRHMRQKGFI